MNQKELIKAVTEDVNKKCVVEEKNTKVTEAVTGDVIKSFVSVSTDALKNGKQVVLSGFGIFKASQRAATTARNPATGETIQVPAKMVPKFKASKVLKDALN